MSTPKNYGPNPGPGHVRHRIWSVAGANPNPLEVPGTVPSMVFHEEKAVRLSDGSERRLEMSRTIVSTFTPGKLVQLRYPESDDLIPGAFMTHEQIYAALYALARQAQIEEDEREDAQAAAAAAHAQQIEDAG